MFKDIIKPSLILFLVCAFVTGALAYVNGVTKPIIDENARIAEQENLKSAYIDADNFQDPKTADLLKSEGIDAGDAIEKLYIAQKDGKSIGYVVAVSSSGYGGKIKMLVGIDNDFNIKGVSLISHKETPGLGAKASEPNFTDQFLGKAPEKTFNVVKRVPNDENEIQAITAATVSSKAVTRGIDDAVALIRSMAGGV
ncbi:MAG: RnfABCDGE type electron transport complex subunit G [Acetivibrionales bacterium]|jgi:electron transport complex protein RnfG|nr:RnfABCDGE type electron transport complex subunit G [Clostridiaceae bacterium]